MCHTVPCTPGNPERFSWNIPPHQHAPTSMPLPGQFFNEGVPMLSPGNAETIPTDTPRPSHDGFFPRRSESF